MGFLNWTFYMISDLYTFGWLYKNSFSPIFPLIYSMGSSDREAGDIS